MSPRRKSPPPHIVVLGGANTDFLVRASRLPRPGEGITGTEFDHAVAGGKGANQAVAAARLGARVTFLGRVGADDRGRALLRRLKAEGVNVQHVIRAPRTPTGVALISVDAQGEKQIVVAPGANLRLTPADIRRPAVARAIQQADILILQFEIPRKTNLAAARLAHKAGVPILLAPAPAFDLRSPNSQLRSSKIRHRPASQRTRSRSPHRHPGDKPPHRTKSRRAPADALPLPSRRHHRAGKGNLAVWREGGSSSAIAHHPSALTHLHLPRLPVKAIDATGAGDAFAAALAVELAEGQPVPTAACFANAAAALATTKLGAQEGLPKRVAVLGFLRHIGAREESRIFNT